MVLPDTAGVCFQEVPQTWTLIGLGLKIHVHKIG